MIDCRPVVNLADVPQPEDPSEGCDLALEDSAEEEADDSVDDVIEEADDSTDDVIDDAADEVSDDSTDDATEDEAAPPFGDWAPPQDTSARVTSAMQTFFIDCLN